MARERVERVGDAFEPHGRSRVAAFFFSVRVIALFVVFFFGFFNLFFGLHCVLATRFALATSFLNDETYVHPIARTTKTEPEKHEMR